jgi:hypothetical protein
LAEDFVERVDDWATCKENSKGVKNVLAFCWRVYAQQFLKLAKMHELTYVGAEAGMLTQKMVYGGSNQIQDLFIHAHAANFADKTVQDLPENQAIQACGFVQDWAGKPPFFGRQSDRGRRPI